MNTPPRNAVRTGSCLAAAGIAAALAAGWADAPAASRQAQCVVMIADADHDVLAAAVADEGPRRVPGHPYARINRWLVAVVPDAQGDAFTTWARRARALDRTARELELRNLGLAPDRRAGIQRCADELLAATLTSASGRAALAAAARVPDDYATAGRVLGLYPITSLGLLAGVDHLHKTIAADFGVPLPSLPVRGRLVRFAPGGPPPGAQGGGAPLSVDALGLPSPAAPRLEALFVNHAPVFEVDVVRPDDRIATLSLDAAGEPVVDHTRPTVYRRVSYTRLGGRMRLQLEYWAWFASRPPSGPLDILGGKLDGVVWRVTLDDRGAALGYDSIHPCGCYHLVFPSRRLLPLPPPARYEEPLMVPQVAPDGVGRLVVRIAQQSHYIQRVYRDTATSGVLYDVEPYDRLRSLALPDGQRRSLFRADGLVPASARPERWLLWMSGIASPGAMRQAGRHAIAFVGRRHFDDADLLSRFFTLMPP